MSSLHYLQVATWVAAGVSVLLCAPLPGATPDLLLGPDRGCLAGRFTCDEPLTRGGLSGRFSGGTGIVAIIPGSDDQVHEILLRRQELTMRSDGHPLVRFPQHSATLVEFTLDCGRTGTEDHCWQ